MMTSRNLSWTLGLLSFLGFLDSTYLTVKHYVGGPLPCSLLQGCETVTTSVYAQIFGIPIALFGALFYLTVLVLVIVEWQTGRTDLRQIIWFLGLIAFIVSLVLIGLQVFVIKALCLYCLGSALTSTLIFLFASLSVRRA